MIHTFSSPIMGQQKAGYAGPLTRYHFTVGHTEVPSVERFVFSPVSEHYQDVKESILKIKTQRILFILARRGKSLSAKDLSGVASGMEIGWAEYGSEVTEIQGKVSGVEGSFNNICPGSSGLGRRFPGEPRQGPGDRHWCSGVRRGQRSRRGPGGRRSRNSGSPESGAARGRLEEGTGRAWLPRDRLAQAAGQIGRERTLRTPTWARGGGRFGKAGDGRALGPARGIRARPGPGAAHGAGAGRGA